MKEETRNGDLKMGQGKETRSSKSKRAFQSKQFQIRESVLTTLYDNPHIKVVKNIFAASLIALVINTAAHDYFEGKQLRVGIGVILHGFGKIHVVAAVWIALNICALLCYFSFSFWANIRVHFPPKAQNIKFWDAIWLLSVPAYYVLQFRIISILVTYFELPIASAAIVCLEQIRLLMKIHAYIRSNVGKVLQFKPHSDKALGLAPVSHYIYFLFAPTLVYKDDYPRSTKIRWNFVMERALELVGVILYYAFLLERFVIPIHKDIGLRPYSTSELFLLVIDNGAVGIMFLLLGFYVVLHTTQNLIGELLKFGDRLFYRDWWTSTNYSDYFRTWNIVVGDWLYTYVYKDCYEFIVPGNKTFAKLLVFTVSALVHEWVMTYICGFFFPALFLAFFFAGGFLSFLPMPKLDIVNIFFWYGLSLGSGTLVSLYSMEYFVRMNVPVAESSSISDFIIPRLFTCNCIV